MKSLGKIFGSMHRVKIMRLFLFNQSTPFDIDDITSRSRVQKKSARKEITMLLAIGFLKKKTFRKKIYTNKKTKTGKQVVKRISKKGWILNKKFDLIEPLYSLLLDSKLVNEKELTKRIKKTGQIKLIILSGLFTRDDDRKLDILVVGNKIKKDALKKEIEILESEIGRELRYTFFDLEEFEYRLGMYDKLVRDIIENPHITLLDKRS